MYLSPVERFLKKAKKPEIPLFSADVAVHILISLEEYDLVYFPFLLCQSPRRCGLI